MNRIRAPVRPILSALLLGGCSLVTAPEVLEDFRFQELQQGHAVEEFVDARGFSGEIIFVGQVKTPHSCFALETDLGREGSTITFRITAVSRNDQCATPLGAYRYTGAVRQVKAGSYDFVVIHAVPGQPEREFKFPVRVQ